LHTFVACFCFKIHEDYVAGKIKLNLSINILRSGPNINKSFIAKSIENTNVPSRYSKHF